MTNSGNRGATLTRLSTGIPGLDAILHGGFFAGSLYIVRGAPGTGKTILTNQIIFHTIRAGGRAVYISLLGESNSRLFAYLQSLSFFEVAPIGDALLYHSASHVIESNNVQELQEMAKRAIVDHHAQVLVIDGLVTMEALRANVGLKQLIRTLQAYCEAYGCTVFLLQDPQEPSYTVDTTSDGIVVLHNTQGRFGGVRELEIRKFRGSAFLEGRHEFQITPDGLHIYPRTEAILRRNAPPTPLREHLRFGIPAFDTMLGGGVPGASVTMIFGTPGSGRTFLGQYFLMEGAAQGEPGLYFGFNESPDELTTKAEQIGLPFAKAVNNGVLHIIWQPAFENVLDQLIEHLLLTIRQHNIRRLVVDGLEGLEQAMIARERLQGVFAALMIELRRLHVTTLFTLELQSLGGPSIDIPVRDVSMLADNIVFLRTVELHSQLRRLISVQKMRRSTFDSSIREFAITDGGIVVDAPFKNAEATLTGQARPMAGNQQSTDEPSSTTPRDQP